MAVYTQVTDTDITALLSRYTIGTCHSLTPIAAGVENSNYLLRTDHGTFILTLFEKRTNEADLPFFMDLMQHLAANDVPCPMPVIDKDGNCLQTVADRPAVIVTFLEGKSIKRIHNHHTAALGRHLARLHLAGQSFTVERTNSVSLPAWQQFYEQMGDKLNTITPGLQDEIAQHLNTLRDNWPSDLPRGVIHADLFPDNVFFQDDVLTGIIDFYFSCTDLLMYDVAICLNSWCFEPSYEFNITKARMLLHAYTAVRPFTSEEIRALPTLASAAAIRFLMTRCYDWLNQVEGAIVTPHDPMEYVTKLRFHQHVTSAADYGLDTVAV